MAVRGRGAGQRQDPESILDAALQEQFAELSAQGSGVESEDVVRAPDRGRQPRREQRRGQRDDEGQSRAADRERDESGRFVPTRSERRSSQDSVDPYSVLVDPDDETADEAVRRPTRTRRTSAPANDDIEDDDEIEDDDDLDDDEDDEDVRPARRRRVADEDEDVDLDLEGDYDPEDDERDEDDERPRARTRRRDEDAEDDRPRGRQKRFSKKVEREIKRQVAAQVGTTLQRAKEAEEETARRKRIDAETGQFLTAALGTPERRTQLENVALNTRLPKDQRDAAANELAIYRRNAGFFEKYKAGALAVIRAEQASDDKAAATAMAELRALDPKVLAQGDRAKTLIHAYATGRALGQQEAMREIKRLKRLLANAGGSRDDRRPSRAGSDSRPARIASGGSRRANGRIGRPDPLLGGMEKVRGIGANSTMPAPTDDLLNRLKNREITLDQIGLGRLRL